MIEYDMAAGRLRSLAQSGLERRLPERGAQNPRSAIPHRYAARLDAELAVVSPEKAQWAITVLELVAELAKSGHRVVPRGTAANLLLTFAMGMSVVDPISVPWERAMGHTGQPPLDYRIDVALGVRSNVASFLQRRPHRTLPSVVADGAGKSGAAKMDVFELPVLSVLAETERLVNEHPSAHGQRFSLDTVPMHDHGAFEMLASDSGHGLFAGELDVGALTRARPRHLDDLAAVRALSRPSVGGLLDEYVARRCGRSRVTPVHPLVDGELERTMGLLVFDEQAMRIWNRVFGVSLADADKRRRWHGRHPPERPEDEAQLLSTARDRGVGEGPAKEILDTLVSAPQSTFPEAHCRTYVRLTYWHAYLKRHHHGELAVACSRVGHDGTAGLEPTSW